MKKHLYLILLLSVSLVTIQSCEKADDGTVWVESQDYGFGRPPWIQDEVAGYNIQITLFFKNLGVEILDVKPYSEWYQGPQVSRQIVYCRIYREYLPIMQEYGFKLVTE